MLFLQKVLKIIILYACTLVNICFEFYGLAECSISRKFYATHLEVFTLKSLINQQGGYVVFLVLSEYSFIRDFRVTVP